MSTAELYTPQRLLYFNREPDRSIEPNIPWGPEDALRCPSTELTDSRRQLFLTEHNSRRSSLARGIQRTANGFAPKASQLYKLVYDCELEKLSQVSAHTCKYVASGYYNDFEENVYTFGRNQLTKEQSIKNAASVWWDEITNVTRQAGKPLIHDTSMTFTQMASDRNVKIGGNSGKRKLYAIGSPCKRDADCTRHDGSYCSVKEGLCNLPLPRRPRHNGADVYLHGWLSLFNGEMTKEELLISIAYFGIVSLLLTVV
ncbi:Ancylostoma secreted protein [Toxocara canis]|uniref:Ancylostoma secreted protein n=1 Tax=Toxocara canis TaxID=6265 RepID=A0A0B2UUL4_TOXCA|nr:Ancylostoma secreted protein [Toxocara canis]